MAVTEQIRADARLRDIIEAAQKRGGAASRAAQRLGEAGLPHRRIEAFRWSDFSASLTDSLRAAGPFQSSFPNADVPGTERALHIVIANGDVHEMVRPRPEGVKVFLDEDAQFGPLIQEAPLGLLAIAMTRKTVRIEVSEASQMPVILIDYVTDHQETSGSRLVVVLRSKARARVIERYSSVSGSGGAHFGLIEYGMQQGAELSRIVLQSGAPLAVLSSLTHIHLAGNARARQTSIASGARLCRLETGVQVIGTGNHVRMNAAYRLQDKAHLDITTTVRHGDAESASDQMVRGVVLDDARSAFQGRIEVVRDAQKTDARMRHDALLLSDRAEVNAKPELEIYADNVQCAHGNTVGSLDEKSLFYMRQRGLGETQARAMLTQAFLAEALETLPQELQDTAFESLGGGRA